MECGGTWWNKQKVKVNKTKNVGGMKYELIYDVLIFIQSHCYSFHAISAHKLSPNTMFSNHLTRHVCLKASGAILRECGLSILISTILAKKKTHIIFAISRASLKLVDL